MGRLRDELVKVISEVGKLDELDDFVALLADNSEVEMDLLIAYDAIYAEAKGTDPVLPSREWIDTNATDREVYEGVKAVAAAAFPKGPDLLRLVPELMPEVMKAVSRGAAAATMAMVSSRSTSSSPPSTAGRRPTSKPTSPTSRSSGTPRKRRSASDRKPSQT